ncbi:hypothetical protein TNCV_4660271 [Trichonephila clavipes]|uniref:Uncharacterized protein n=1 Tax=Trichonephila clavipes TaxID=2585209 RepID=A0A8X6S8I5_TRICX|nr:hypothetical protein TNCV_4660271 [Trichonephila clavipes]
MLTSKGTRWPRADFHANEARKLEPLTSSTTVFDANAVTNKVTNKKRNTQQHSGSPNYKIGCLSSALSSVPTSPSFEYLPMTGSSKENAYGLLSLDLVTWVMCLVW